MADEIKYEDIMRLWAALAESDRRYQASPMRMFDGVPGDGAQVKATLNDELAQLFRDMEGE